jgi:hypothetical protein
MGVKPPGAYVAVISLEFGVVFGGSRFSLAPSLCGHRTRHRPAGVEAQLFRVRNSPSRCPGFSDPPAPAHLSSAQSRRCSLFGFPDRSRPGHRLWLVSIRS